MSSPATWVITAAVVRGDGSCAPFHEGGVSKVNGQPGKADAVSVERAVAEANAGPGRRQRCRAPHHLAVAVPVPAFAGVHASRLLCAKTAFCCCPCTLSRVCLLDNFIAPCKRAVSQVNPHHDAGTGLTSGH